MEKIASTKCSPLDLASQKKVDRAMAAILTSGTTLDLKTLLLQQASLSFAIKLTPLEYGISMRCKSSVESCLTALNNSQPEELAQVLNTFIEPSTTLAQKLVDKGFDKSLLISFGFLDAEAKAAAEANAAAASVRLPTLLTRQCACMRLFCSHSAIFFLFLISLFLCFSFFSFMFCLACLVFLRVTCFAGRTVW